MRVGIGLTNLLLNYTKMETPNCFWNGRQFYLCREVLDYTGALDSSHRR